LIKEILSGDKIQHKEASADSSFEKSDLEEVPLIEQEPVLKEAKIVKKESKESCKVRMEEEVAFVHNTSFGSEELNFCQRDPNGLNSDCVVAFEDVIGENEVPGQVPDRLWTCSQQTFAFCQYWSYFVLSVIAAGPAALYWGIYYAVIACSNTWCFTPWFRALKIHLGMYKKLWGAVVHCVCDPCVEVCNACKCFIRKQ